MRYIKHKKIILCVILITIIFAFGKNPFEITKQIEVYGDFFRIFNENYVDNISPESLNTSAIKKVLEETDPYTSFFNQKTIQKGTIDNNAFSNIGFEFTFIDDHIFITSLSERLSKQTGLKIGDKIITVDGFEVQNFGEGIIELFKGVAGSNLNLRIERRNQTLVVNLPIENSPYKSSVPVFKKIDDTGYIALKRFDDQSTKEVKTAFSFLQSEGIENLILDLRGNPGGLLSQVVSIINLFVPKQTLVVTMKGKSDKHFKEFFTQNDPIDMQIPIVVLIDESSASASEIVAGSLQDLDRAVIIGNKSFGKGLVQQYFDIKYGGQLKVTVARYYTPSGRCIQKLDYSRKDEYGNAQENTETQLLSFKTKNKRSVFGGGGITPEIIVDSVDSFTRRLQRDYTIFKFVNQYFEIKNSDLLSQKDWENFKSIYKKEQQTLKIQSEIQNLLEQKGYENSNTLAQRWTKDLEKQTLQNIEKHKTNIIKAINQEVLRRTISNEKTYLEAKMKGDKTLETATRLLTDSSQYQLLLQP